MIYAASNIAWPYAQRREAYSLLSAAGFRGLEIAPSLFFADEADPFLPSLSEKKRALTEIQDAGLSLVSMQSLLFGVQGAALFEGPVAMHKLEIGILRAIDLAGDIGIPNLVFGSPRQRVRPEGMEESVAIEIAMEVFSRLGDRAAQAETVIAIEANPTLYGTNFLTDAFSALAFVSQLRHPNVRFILDLGERHVNSAMDELPELLNSCTSSLSHIHISEPQLAVAPADAVVFAKALQLISDAGYSRSISIEMSANKDDPLAQLEIALTRVNSSRELLRRSG